MENAHPDAFCVMSDGNEKKIKGEKRDCHLRSHRMRPYKDYSSWRWGITARFNRVTPQARVCVRNDLGLR